jgi:hypothetical protein
MVPSVATITLVSDGPVNSPFVFIVSGMGVEKTTTIYTRSVESSGTVVLDGDPGAGSQTIM